VVAAATGAVGSIVGQIAKLKGARTVGIAGGPEKCRYAIEQLGFDLCMDHREPDLGKRLATACPAGIDVYFENVGGAVFDAVLPRLNVGARIPLCGFVASYNDEQLPPGPNRVPLRRKGDAPMLSTAEAMLWARLSSSGRKRFWSASFLATSPVVAAAPTVTRWLLTSTSRKASRLRIAAADLVTSLAEMLRPLRTNTRRFAACARRRVRSTSSIESGMKTVGCPGNSA